MWKKGDKKRNKGNSIKMNVGTNIDNYELNQCEQHSNIYGSGDEATKEGSINNETQ